MTITWLIFETLGTIAFAFSGTVVGLSRRMDIFGITVLAVMTGVGGGMVRDVLCGITPPSVLRSPDGLFVSFLYPVYRVSKENERYITFMYNISDTVGLAAFTVTGALTAFYQYPDSYRFLLPTMLGLITAVGGGMLRDMMARRMPVVLYMDVYAIASIAGGLVLCCLRHFTVLELSVSSWIAFSCVTLLRFCAIHFHWQLYHPHRKRRRPKK